MAHECSIKTHQIVPIYYLNKSFGNKTIVVENRNNCEFK